MRNASLLLIALVTTLSVLCIYLGYQIFDEAISLNHARTGQRIAAEESAILRKLTVDIAKGVGRNTIKDLLVSKYARDHIINEEGGDTIYVDGVGLRFRGDELVGIVFMSDTDRRASALPR